MVRIARARSNRGLCGWCFLIVKNALIVGPQQTMESFIVVGTKNGFVKPGAEFGRHGKTCILRNHGRLGLLLDRFSCSVIRDSQPLKQTRHNLPSHRHNLPSLGGRLQVSTQDQFDAGWAFLDNIGPLSHGNEESQLGLVHLRETNTS